MRWRRTCSSSRPDARGGLYGRDGRPACSPGPSPCDLLTHTSGLPDRTPLQADLRQRIHTLAEAVMAYSQRPLEFEPGSSWAYFVWASTPWAGSSRSPGRPMRTSSASVFAPLGMKDDLLSHPSSSSGPPCPASSR
ncbi:MAG: serine hydrolase [Singulisphaera sp.]